MRAPPGIAAISWTYQREGAARLCARERAAVTIA
jgi:hypothetical protein